MQSLYESDVFIKCNYIELIHCDTQNDSRTANYCRNFVHPITKLKGHVSMFEEFAELTVSTKIGLILWTELLAIGVRVVNRSDV